MKMKEIIAQALFDAENKMPAGAGWNLSSKAACDQLAESIDERLKRAAKKNTELYLELY